MISSLSNKPKNRRIASLLALVGVISPVSGLHKFYLGQPSWGVIYLLLSWTMIPKVASALEGVWYLIQDREEFDSNFNDTGLNSSAVQPMKQDALHATPAVDPAQVSAIAEALRQLDQLRQDGLISEYEFEQKRRQFLDRIA